jgi:hypothetical protein
MSPWNLAEERNQLQEFELIAAGHSRSDNERLATLYWVLIRATKRKISALESIERELDLSKSKTA